MGTFNAHKTSPNNETCHLLDILPAELRLEIYSLALADFMPSTKHGATPAIIRACRHTRNECMKLFFLRSQQLVEEIKTEFVNAWADQEAAYDDPFGLGLEEWSELDSRTCAAEKKKVKLVQWQDKMLVGIRREGYPIAEWRKSK